MWVWPGNTNAAGLAAWEAAYWAGPWPIWQAEETVSPQWRRPCRGRGCRARRRGFLRRAWMTGGRGGLDVVELVPGNDGNVVFLQKLDGLIGAVEAEDDDRRAFALVYEGVHVFHIDAASVEQV